MAVCVSFLSGNEFCTYSRSTVKFIIRSNRFLRLYGLWYGVAGVAMDRFANMALK